MRSMRRATSRSNGRRHCDQAVVDDLEAIDVQEQQAAYRSGWRRIRARAGQAVEQHNTVGQAVRASLSAYVRSRPSASLRAVMSLIEPTRRLTAPSSRS